MHAAYRGTEERPLKLETLLSRLDYRILQGTVGQDISEVVYDSRKVCEGCIFICIVGAHFDAHDRIGDAAAAGARAIVVQDDHDVAVPGGEVTVISVPSTRRALSFISAAWFGYPAEKIPVIGITGTKGKTTTTYMVKSILDNAGHKTGLIGTIEVIVGDTRIHALNTTPESYIVQKYLHDMIEAGMDCAVMEVSSQALMMDRTAGLEFEIGVFTNISPDHIGPNEHTDFAQYLYCKSLLFQQCRTGVFNLDDPHTKDVMLAADCAIETYGIENPEATIWAENIRHIHRPGYLGVSFDVRGKQNFPVELDIPGKFSVYNALTAVSICRHFHIPEDVICAALKVAKVKGRIEMVPVSDQFTLMIDYAHNAMALESLLSTLRDYDPGRLVCLFGCGGDRSRDRRFEMGETSGRMADLTIITSDNPRTEKPEDIIADIRTGIERTDGKFIEIIDRREAIAYAIHNGLPGDIIVLAGKGHEDYQEINGVRYPMDERNIIKDILEADALRGSNC